MAGMIVWGRQIWKESSKGKLEKRPDPAAQLIAATQSVKSGTENAENRTQEDEPTVDPPDSQPAVTQKAEGVSHSQYSIPLPEGESSGPSMVHFWLCVLLIIPIISAIQLVFYRLLPLHWSIPDKLISSLDTLLYISTICVGLVVILTIWLGIKNLFSDKRTMQLRLPAILAFLLELIIFALFFYKIDAVDPSFLDKFLASVTNNTIAAMIVIPIVVFVILDVGISLFITAFFNGIDSDQRGWPKFAAQKLDGIQQRIVMFALNMIIGVLNLFLFIPDFFNELGDLLLSKDDIFPEFEESGPTPDFSNGTKKSGGQKKQ